MMNSVERVMKAEDCRRPRSRPQIGRVNSARRPSAAGHLALRPQSPADGRGSLARLAPTEMMTKGTQTVTALATKAQTCRRSRVSARAATGPRPSTDGGKGHR